MANGISELHDCCITHRDLKPENIAFKDERLETLKILDFGLSVNKAQFNDTSGTRFYKAPEVIKNEQSKMGNAADVWAFGTILYELLFKSYPFGDHSNPNNYQKSVLANTPFSLSQQNQSEIS